MLKGLKFLTGAGQRTDCTQLGDMEQRKIRLRTSTKMRKELEMKTNKWTLSIFITTFFVVGLATITVNAQVAIKGETIYTMAGSPIKDGVVLIRDGKVEKVGPASTVTIPNGYKTLSAKVVTPGLIDAHTVVGLSGYLNQPQDQDQLEKSTATQPELRAIDAYNSREKLVEYLRGFGITTIHT